jgi:hypothetical protein
VQLVALAFGLVNHALQCPYSVYTLKPQSLAAIFQAINMPANLGREVFYYRLLSIIVVQAFSFGSELHATNATIAVLCQDLKTVGSREGSHSKLHCVYTN